MSKKILAKAAMMAPLFPQYDQEEEARLLKESEKKILPKGQPKKMVSAKGSKKKEIENKREKSVERAESKRLGVKGKGSVSVERQASSSSAKKSYSVKNTPHGDHKKVEQSGSSGKVQPHQETIGTVQVDCGGDRQKEVLPKWSPSDSPASQKLSIDQAGEPRMNNKILFDIPEDALPPPRPEPVLTLRPSAQLHSKLIAQAKEEGISPEMLALEMLSESVVLRAWEIIERKGAMRGQTGHNGYNGLGHHQGRNQRNHRNFDPNMARNSHHQEPNYNSFHYQNSSNSGQQQNYQSSGYNSQRSYRSRPASGWKEDQGAFLEYVRNQEKNGRR